MKTRLTPEAWNDVRAIVEQALLRDPEERGSFLDKACGVKPGLPAQVVAVVSTWNDKQAWPGRIHSGGSNVLFCDGHVTWYPQASLLVTGEVNAMQAQIRRMWNNDHEPNW